MDFDDEALSAVGMQRQAEEEEEAQSRSSPRTSSEMPFTFGTTIYDDNKDETDEKVTDENYDLNEIHVRRYRNNYANVNAYANANVNANVNVNVNALGYASIVNSPAISYNVNQFAHLYRPKTARGDDDDDDDDHHHHHHHHHHRRIVSTSRPQTSMRRSALSRFRGQNEAVKRDAESENIVDRWELSRRRD